MGHLVDVTSVNIMTMATKSKGQELITLCRTV